MQVMHTSMHLVCKKCKYEWEYAGNKHRTSCSKCKTSITLSGLDMTNKQIDEALNSKPLQLKISVKVLNGIEFNRARLWAKVNGDEYIKLKADENGVLSLPT